MGQDHSNLDYISQVSSLGYQHSISFLQTLVICVIFLIRLSPFSFSCVPIFYDIDTLVSVIDPTRAYSYSFPNT